MTTPTLSMAECEARLERSQRMLAEIGWWEHHRRPVVWFFVPAVLICGMLHWLSLQLAILVAQVLFIVVMCGRRYYLVRAIEKIMAEMERE